MTREEAIKSIKLFFEGLRVALSNETKEAFNTLIPELTESKDERIRKFLINILSHGTWQKEWPFGPNEVVDYLEKQKPERINITEMVAKYSATDEYVEGDYKGKPVNCMIRAYEQGIRDTLLKVKEQKSAELSDEELQRHQDELYDFKVFATKQAREYHISFVHDFEWNNFCAELLSYFNENPVEYIKRNSKEWYALLTEQYDKGFWKGKMEQKPAEWREEDEKMLEVCSQYIGNTIPTDYDEEEFTVKDCRNWLKSLPERFNLQPKQEWNEQNKKWFDAIIKDYEESLSGDEEHDPAIQIKINLLKSLRPSWKPSEEQPVEGLEDEIKRYLHEECSGDDEPSVSDIARHFAEWGAEYLKK